MKDLKKEIEWVLLNKIKVVEDGFHSYYGTPNELLVELTRKIETLLLEERKKTLEEVWGVINEKLDTLDINTQEQEVNVLVWLNKKIDVAITRLSKLLKEGNEKE